MPRTKKDLPVSWRKLLREHPSTKGGKNVDDVSLWRNCVYYLWWEYLCRNDGYRNACETHEFGEFQKVYSDFGNVHSQEFIPWWHERGRALFAEPVSEFQVREVLNENDEQDYSDERFLILEIPLNKQYSRIERELKKLVNQRQKERGYTFTDRPSNAKYPVWRNPVIEALKTGLKIWDTRQNHPEYPLWKVGRIVGVSDGITPAEYRRKKGYLSEKEIEEQRRNRLRRVTHRYLKQAERRIYWVGRGFFPRDDDIST